MQYFNKQVYLITTTATSDGEAEKNRKKVWAKVADPSLTFKFSASSAGYTADVIAYLWRREYNNQPVIEIDSRKYRVVDIGTADKDLFVKLILSKGA